MSSAQPIVRWPPGLSGSVRSHRSLCNPRGLVRGHPTRGPRLDTHSFRHLSTAGPPAGKGGTKTTQAPFARRRPSRRELSEGARVQARTTCRMPPHQPARIANPAEWGDGALNAVASPPTRDPRCDTFLPIRCRACHRSGRRRRIDGPRFRGRAGLVDRDSVKEFPGSQTDCRFTVSPPRTLLSCSIIWTTPKRVSYLSAPTSIVPHDRPTPSKQHLFVRRRSGQPHLRQRLVPPVAEPDRGPLSAPFDSVDTSPPPTS